MDQTYKVWKEDGHHVSGFAVYLGALKYANDTAEFDCP